MSYLDYFGNLSEEIITKLSNITVATMQDVDDPVPVAEDQLPKSLVVFYQELSHLNFEWETKELVDSNGHKLQGRINILKAEGVLQDWKGIVYFNDDDSDRLKTFKIVDNFVAEAHCGFLLNENNSDAMYYHESGEPELEPIAVDFNGYLELMFAARGFWYWQRVILNLRNSKGYENVVEQFKTYMPQIFPDFKWEEFVALYERVRIK